MLSVNKKQKFITGIIFLSLLIVTSIYYNYNQYLFYRPQSVHAWRQADCASLTLNYYQKDANFFKPQTHNLNSDNGTSSFCATSEMPLLYYFSSLLYKIFGPHEFILRLLNTLIFYMGLFYLYKIFALVIKDSFWAIALSLLFFTSPVLVYYGNNYLTNVSALSFSISGLYFFLFYLKEGNKTLILKSLLLFFLAGSFKLPALMAFFAIGAYVLYDYLFLRKKKNAKIKNHLYIIIGSLLVITPILAWITYAKRYNVCHDCSYFSTTIFPIWSFSIDDIITIARNIRKNWLDSYFHFSVHAFISFLTLISILNFRKIKTHYSIILYLLCFQSFIFIALQFWTFQDHDYYTIGQYIVPIFITISAFSYLKDNHKKIIGSIFVKILFTIFLLFNIYHCNKIIDDRYTGWRNKYYKERKDIYTITPFLRAHEITTEDKIIYIPDGSNVALYLMNQFGWTQYTDAKFNRSEPIKFNQDSLGISQSIKRGAKYLIMNSENDIYKYPYLKPYAKHLLGQYGKAMVFDLTDTINNYKLKSGRLRISSICDAEKTNENNYYEGTAGILFGNGITQSTEFAFEGTYSCKVNSENLYGMTFKTSDIKGGDFFQITVWRQGSSEGHLVASGPPENNFYISENRIIGKSKDGNWSQMKLEFFVPMEMTGKELKIYVYNPSSNPIYFDNLEIKIINFESI